MWNHDCNDGGSAQMHGQSFRRLARQGCSHAPSHSPRRMGAQQWWLVLTGSRAHRKRPGAAERTRNSLRSMQSVLRVRVT